MTDQILIPTIINSLICSIYGIYKLYLFMFNYNMILNENIDDIYMTNIFIFYLILDILAHIYYNIPMNLVTCKIHHTLYIIFLLFLRFDNYSHIFTIFTIEEIPTFLLTLAQYDNKYRNDNLFGFTFFLFRIIYHLYICILFIINYPVPLYSYVVSILTSFLHIYWFYNWYIKYFLVIKQNKIENNN